MNPNEVFDVPTYLEHSVVPENFNSVDPVIGVQKSEGYVIVSFATFLL